MGGIRITKKICLICSLEFDSQGGAKYCIECRYIKQCLHCKQNFNPGRNSRNRRHCNICKDLNIWKMGKFPDRGMKISKSKKEFFQTDLGKEIADRVGKINSVKMKEYNSNPDTLDSRLIRNKKISNILKFKIANGIFTPKITNTRTHWNAKIILDSGIVRKFRSSWEAVFWNCNQYLEFETLRIPWIDEFNESHSYIADFYDRNNNIIYEIKPHATWSAQQTKMQQIIRHCLANSIKFIWINEDNILNYIKEEEFSGENYKQYQKVINGIKKNKNIID
jgi:hypothetical protein